MEQYLTAKLLREHLSYDQETGLFTRIASASRSVKVGDIAGSVNGAGYVCISVCGSRYLAHRLAWLFVTEAWPIAQIDHRDGNKTNNRFTNLRDVANATNSQNQKQPRKNNKSGFLGVIWFARDSNWRAEIQVDGKTKHIGYFATAELAHAAYLLEKRKRHPGFIGI